jgi:hypothetical protein
MGWRKDLERIGLLSAQGVKGGIEMALKKMQPESIMDDTDWQHVLNLLSVSEMAARHGPRYVSISRYAEEELDDIKKQIDEEVAKQQKAKAEEALKAKAKAMADAKASEGQPVAPGPGSYPPPPQPQPQRRI